MCPWKRVKSKHKISDRLWVTLDWETFSFGLNIHSFAVAMHKR
jgi:hypothetical protein